MRIVMAAAAAAVIATAAISGHALAAKPQQSKMQQCAAQWQDLKKANKTGGQDYKTFSSNCMKGGAAPAAAPAPAPMPVATAPAAGGGKMQQCAAQWNDLKAHNRTGGQDYKTFSSNCMKGTTQVAMAPTVAPKSKPAAAVVPAGGKMSQQDRMKQCGAQWTQMKAQNKTNGMTYKQWSSQCLRTH